MSKATSLALRNKTSSHQAKVDLTSHRHGLYSGEADGSLSFRALCSVLPLILAYVIPPRKTPSVVLTAIKTPT